ncbi:MAG: ABC transporter ATP-binding protein [Cyanobacteria bacterium M5B4]|nr:MAG: ABC transporter ATP-binding protein [Cyanobacteria bacterium M5B4]
MFQIQELTVSYQTGMLALDRVSMSVDRGEIVALVGESGCGKSTLARAVLGILPPSAQIGGKIWLEGEEIIANLTPGWRGAKAGLIFQDPMTRFNPFMPIVAHAREMLAAHGVPPSEVRQRLSQALAKVKIDPDRAQNYAHELSGGMRQRVMIALTLLLQPKLLIADEPTTSLDAKTARGILQEIVDLCRQEERGMILISHDLNLVRRYCDRVAVMLEGRIVETNTPERLFCAPEHAYTQSLVASYRPYQRVCLPSSLPILEAKHLTKRYGNFVAVEDVSFVLYAQEVLGIIGESGCGKSTTARMLANLIKPDRGEISIGDRSLSRPARARKVQMIFQDPRASLNPAMTIGQAIADPLYIHKMAVNVTQQVGAVLDQVGLSRSLVHRSPKELSGGQLQRVAIARALILQPEILICDEPVSMLDASLQQQILQLLSDLQRSYQLSLIFITHDLNLAHHFCDRLLVMYQGKIVETGQAKVIMTNPQHPYTQSLVNN